MSVKFGTSGWREIIAEKFTFHSLSIVIEAICDYLDKENLSNKGVVIGRDTRFMGEVFSQFAATQLSLRGIKVFLCERDVPTPVISYEIRRRGAGGGLNFTASHNPPEYQGLKFSTADGAPALPEITSFIESTCIEIRQHIEQGKRSLHLSSDSEFHERVASGHIELINPNPAYLKRLEDFVDVDIIASSGMKVYFDPLYGTARDYTDGFLRRCGIEVMTIHNHRDVYFGGRPPEPSEKHIPELIALVKESASKGEFVIGLANDGDADRYAVVDQQGVYLQANQLLAILFHYALRHKPTWHGCVVRTLATTHLIDAIAKKESVTLYDVPVGFKYIGEVMMREPMILGGEESNGLSVFEHIPEKDGVLACLLFAEITARLKKPLSVYLQELYSEYGYFSTVRENFRLTQEKKDALLDRLKHTPPTSLAGVEVIRRDERDGVKLICLDGSWLLVRFSGTEPVVRLYVESNQDERTARVVEEAKSWIN